MKITSEVHSHYPKYTKEDFEWTYVNIKDISETQLTMIEDFFKWLGCEIGQHFGWELEEYPYLAYDADNSYKDYVVQNLHDYCMNEMVRSNYKEMSLKDLMKIIERN